MNRPAAYDPLRVALRSTALRDRVKGPGVDPMPRAHFLGFRAQVYLALATCRCEDYNHERQGIPSMIRGKRNVVWGTVIDRRALLLWPKLDSRALRSCGHEPRRIARLVARRTSLAADAIVAMLIAPEVSAEEAETWFG